MVSDSSALRYFDGIVDNGCTYLKRILVIGDGMVDRYVYGRIEPCQEECKKFVRYMDVLIPGGAANAAHALQNWQVEKMFLCDTGIVKTRLLTTSEDGVIRCVLRYDDDAITVDVNQARKDIVKALKARYHDAVLISDYDKGLLDEQTIGLITSICSFRRTPCVADAKRRPSVYSGAIIKCNSDYQHRYNRDLSSEVYEGKGTLVVTAGADTPAVWQDGKILNGFGFMPPVRCANHVGAGDCFGAHLALALAYGVPLKEATEIAHSAGRVYVQHPHNRPPLLEEIRADLALAAH